MPTLQDLSPEGQQRVNEFVDEIKEVHRSYKAFVPEPLLMVFGNMNIILTQLLIRAEYAEERLGEIESKLTQVQSLTNSMKKRR